MFWSRIHFFHSECQFTKKLASFCLCKYRGPAWIPHMIVFPRRKSYPRTVPNIEKEWYWSEQFCKLCQFIISIVQFHNAVSLTLTKSSIPMYYEKYVWMMIKLVSTHNLAIAQILTSNSVGTQLFFLSCNQDNNHGFNFITKKKICLVLPEKEISNHRN